VRDRQPAKPVYREAVRAPGPARFPVRGADARAVDEAVQGAARVLEDPFGDRVELIQLAEVAGDIGVGKINRDHACAGGTHRRDGRRPDSCPGSGDRVCATFVRSHAQEPPDGE